MRDIFKRVFGDARRHTAEAFDAVEKSFDDMARQFEELDRMVLDAEREATWTKPGETITTKREERRPDGTVVTTVTTVTRSASVTIKR